MKPSPFILQILILFLSHTTVATTYYSKSGQSIPNNLTNWTLNNDGTGVNPSNFTTAADIFVVQSGHNYTTTAAWNVSGTVEVLGILTIQTSNSIKILTIKNGGLVNGNQPTTITASGSGGQFNMESNARYVNNHTNGMASTIFNGAESFNSNSTFEYKNMTTAFTSSIIYGNFIFDVNLNRSFPTSITINGNFEIKQGTLDFVSARTIQGNYTQSGGIVTLYNSTINGNYNQSSGTARITTETNVSRQLNIGGDFLLTSGTFYLNDGPQNTIGFATSLNVTGDITIDGGNFNFPTSSTTAVAGRIFAQKNLKLLSGSIGGYLSTTTLTAGVYFSGTVNQTFESKFPFSNGNLRDAFYYKTTLGPTGLNEIYSGNIAQIAIKGDFGTPVTGYSRWDTTGLVLKNFTINNASGLDLRNPRFIIDTLYRTVGNITFSNTGKISYASNASLVYNGLAIITTQNSEFPVSNGPKNLIIDNPANVTLHTDRTLPVSGVLKFIQGKLITGNCNPTTSNTTITINDDGSVIGSGNNKYIVGICRKIGDDAFTFPVGSNDYFAPIGINAPIVTSDEFKACYNYGTPDALFERDSLEPILNHVSNCEFWILNRTNGSSQVQVTLSWDSRSCGITSIADLRVSRWNGTKWTDGGNTLYTGTNASGSLNSTTFSSFSPFTLASINTQNPLPVEILSYDVSYINKEVLNKWTTMVEINNDFFEIQRSQNGIDFYKIGIENGNGNTNEISSYHFWDKNPVNGLMYYRLKQVDFNGESSYSPIRVLNLNSENSYYISDSKIFSNNISSNCIYLKIFSVSGELILNNCIELPFNLPQVNRGMYLVEIENSSFSQKLKWIKN